MLACRMLRRCCCTGLTVADGAAAPRAGGRGVREIPLAEITGTLEPNRAAQFDPRSGRRRARASAGSALWLAEARGAILPPISVVPAAGGYAVSDGHHRVSVALARGAVSIDAVVSAR